MSISPARRHQRNRSRGGDFQVKPATVNHFTGQRLAADHGPEMEEAERRKPLGAGPDADKELHVQVGDRTQVFKYGEEDAPKPKLIDEYISYFKGKTTPARHRSHSEEAYSFNRPKHARQQAGPPAHGQQRQRTPSQSQSPVRP